MIPPYNTEVYYSTMLSHEKTLNIQNMEMFLYNRI
jgi:hypothetical protein